MILKKSNTIEELIDDDTLYQKEILTILAKNNGEWVPTSHLVNKLNLNADTISKYYKQLELNVRQIKNPKFKLEISRNKGIALTVGLGEDIRTLIGYLLSKSPAIRLLENIFSESFDSIKQYAQLNFISESTVRRYIKKIKMYFRDYNVYITRGKIRLTGEEKQIRILMSIFYWEVYGGITWPFKNISEYKLDSLANSFFKKGFLEQVRIPFLYKRQFMYYFAESITRTRKKNIIQPEEILYENIRSSEAFIIFNASLQEFKGIINTCTQEVIFHYIVALTVPGTAKMINKSLLKKFLYDQKERYTLVYQASILLIQKAQLDPQKIDDTLLANIHGFHIFAKNFGGFDSGLFGNTDASIFPERYPELTRKIQQFIDELYNESQNPIFLEKSYLLNIYTRLFSMFIPLNKYEKKITILLESDTSYIVTKMIEEKILGLFSNQFNLSLIDALQPHKPEDIDIILSTISIDVFSDIYINAKIIPIDPVLTLNNIYLIENCIDNIFKKRSP